MPVTFLAHQAPLFPLKRWRPGLDGVAFVAGTLAPDLSTASLHTEARYLLGSHCGSTATSSTSSSGCACRSPCWWPG